jgi:hypothetical protein
MATPKQNIHIGVSVAAIVVGAILAILTGGDPYALVLASGVTTGVGYWLGAAAQRKHG